MQNKKPSYSTMPVYTYLVSTQYYPVGQNSQSNLFPNNIQTVQSSQKTVNTSSQKVLSDYKKDLFSQNNESFRYLPVLDQPKYQVINQFKPNYNENIKYSSNQPRVYQNTGQVLQYSSNQVKRQEQVTKAFNLQTQPVERESYSANEVDSMVKSLSQFYVEAVVQRKKQHIFPNTKQKIRQSLLKKQDQLNQTSSQRNSKEVQQYLEDMNVFFKEIQSLLDQDEKEEVQLFDEKRVDLQNKKISILENQNRKLKLILEEKEQQDRVILLEEQLKAYQIDINEMIPRITEYKNRNANLSDENRQLTHELNLLKKQTEIMKEDIVKKMNPQNQQKLDLQNMVYQNDMKMNQQLQQQLDSKNNELKKINEYQSEQILSLQYKLEESQKELVKLSTFQAQFLNDQSLEDSQLSTRNQIMDAKIQHQNLLIVQQKEKVDNLMKMLEQLKEKISQKYKHTFIDSEIQKISETVQTYIDQNKQIQDLNEENCNLRTELADVLDYLSLMNKQQMISMKDFDVIQNSIEPQINQNTSNVDSSYKTPRKSRSIRKLVLESTEKLKTDQVTVDTENNINQDINKKLFQQTEQKNDQPTNEHEKSKSKKKQKYKKNKD